MSENISESLNLITEWKSVAKSQSSATSQQETNQNHYSHVNQPDNLRNRFLIVHLQFFN